MDAPAFTAWLLHRMEAAPTPDMATYTLDPAGVARTRLVVRLGQGIFHITVLCVDQGRD